jgi:hypothetical protein
MAKDWENCGVVHWDVKPGDALVVLDHMVQLDTGWFPAPTAWPLRVTAEFVATEAKAAHRALSDDRKFASFSGRCIALSW